jgi:hypothetical protein
MKRAKANETRVCFEQALIHLNSFQDKFASLLAANGHSRRSKSIEAKFNDLRSTCVATMCDQLRIDPDTGLELDQLVGDYP